MNEQTQQPEAETVSEEQSQPSFVRDLTTAKRFFERAAEVANTSGGLDYAIDLYRDGLKWDPESLEGHRALREVALRRKAANGKKASLKDQANLRRAREPLDKMLAAEYMLAKEPENAKYAEMAMQAAAKLGTNRTAKWLANLVIELNRGSGKPSIERYLAAADALESIEEYADAVPALQLACRIKENDQQLLQRLKNVSAEATMKKAHYDRDFRESLDDAEGQAEAQEDQRLVQSEDTIERQIRTARQEYEAEPEVPGKIFALVEALTKRGREDEENEAIQVLHKAYKATGSYRFKERAGDIRIRQNARKAREAAEDLKADPKNPQLQAQAREIVSQARAFEEQEYAERVKNYPTDMSLKYEYGRRLFANQKYDDAIPMLQQAQNDPKNRLRAQNLLGQAFFGMGFHDEAVDTFRRAIGEMEATGNDLSKELYYHLGRALEEQGENKEADEAFSQVLQWDFNYRDVRDRIKKLRERRDDGEAASA
jgi:hypothetical protein